MSNIFEDIGNGVGSVVSGIGQAFENPFQSASSSPQDAKGFEDPYADSAHARGPAVMNEAPRPALVTQPTAPMQQPTAPMQQPQGGGERSTPGSAAGAMIPVSPLPPPPAPPSMEPPEGYTRYANPLAAMMARTLDPVGYETDRKRSWAENTQPVYQAQLRQYETSLQMRGQQLAMNFAQGDLISGVQLLAQNPQMYKAISENAGFADRFASPEMQDVLGFSIRRLQNANTPAQLEQAKTDIERLYPASKPILDRYNGNQLKSLVPMFQDWQITGAERATSLAVRQRESGLTWTPRGEDGKLLSNGPATIPELGLTFDAPQVRNKVTGDIVPNWQRAASDPSVALTTAKEIDAKAKEVFDITNSTREMDRLSKTLERAPGYGPQGLAAVRDAVAQLQTKLGAAVRVGQLKLEGEHRNIGDRIEGFLNLLDPEKRGMALSDSELANYQKIARDLVSEAKDITLGRRNEAVEWAANRRVPLKRVFREGYLPEDAQEQYDAAAANRDRVLQSYADLVHNRGAGPTSPQPGGQPPSPPPAGPTATPPAAPPRPAMASLSASPGASGGALGFGAAPAALGGPSSGSIVEGVSPAFAGKVRTLESGGDYSARASTSSAHGAYQFTNATGAKYGVHAGSTPAEQDAGFAQLTRDNANALRNANIPVDDVTMYMAHQQGATGAKKLLTAPDNAPAAAVVGKTAAVNNPAYFFENGKTTGRPLTVAEVKQRFADKVNGAAPASEIGTGKIGRGVTAGGTFAEPGVSAAGGTQITPRAPNWLDTVDQYAPGLVDTAIQSVAAPATRAAAMGAPPPVAAALGSITPTARIGGTAISAAAMPAAAFSGPLRGALVGGVMGAAGPAADAALDAYAKSGDIHDALRHMINPQSILGGALGGILGGAGGAVTSALNTRASRAAADAVISHATDEELVAGLNPGAVHTLETLAAKGEPLAHKILQRVTAARATGAERAVADRTQQGLEAANWERAGANELADQGLQRAETTAAQDTGAARLAQSSGEAAAEQAAQHAQQTAAAVPEPYAVAGEPAQMIQSATQQHAAQLESTAKGLYDQVRDSGVWTGSRAVRNAPAAAREALAEEGHIDASTLGPQTRVALNLLDKLSETLAEKARAPLSIKTLVDMDQRINAVSRRATDGADKYTLGIVQRQYQESMMDSLTNRLMRGPGEATAKTYQEAKQAYSTFKSFLEPKGADADIKGFKVLSTIAKNPDASTQEVANWLIGAADSGFSQASTHVVDAFRQTFGNDPQAMTALKSMVVERIIGNATEPAKISANISKFLSSPKSKAVAARLFEPEERRGLANVARQIGTAADKAEAARISAAQLAKLADKVEREGARNVRSAERTAERIRDRGEARALDVSTRARNEAYARVEKTKERAQKYAGPSPGLPEGHQYPLLISIEQAAHALVHLATGNARAALGSAGSAASVIAGQRGFYAIKGFMHGQKTRELLLKALGPRAQSPSFRSWAGEAATRAIRAGAQQSGRASESGLDYLRNRSRPKAAY